MNTFTLKLRTLALSAVVAAAVCWVGCGGGDDNPGGNSGNNNVVVDPNTVESGTFTDGRDGTVYKTVKIGGQTWMAENLNLETANGSWCYDNSPDNCAKWGRLYAWSAAVTACQSEGWRLPTLADWDVLVSAAGGWEVAGKALKSTSGWDSDGNGTDKYGFSALPGGYRMGSGSLFAGKGILGYWWTATKAYDAGYYCMTFSTPDAVTENFNAFSFGYSVRCIKDD